MVRVLMRGRCLFRDSRCCTVSFKSGGRSHAQPLEAGKGKDSSLEPPKGTQPYQHLDFSPVRLMSILQHPEL